MTYYRMISSDPNDLPHILQHLQDLLKISMILPS